MVGAFEIVLAQDRGQSELLGQDPADLVRLVGEHHHGVGVGRGSGHAEHQIVGDGPRRHHVGQPDAECVAERTGPWSLDHRGRRHQIPNGIQVVRSADGSRIRVGGHDECSHQSGLDRGLDETQVLPLATAARRDER